MQISMSLLTKSLNPLRCNMLPLIYQEDIGSGHEQYSCKDYMASFLKIFQQNYHHSKGLKTRLIWFLEHLCIFVQPIRPTLKKQENYTGNYKTFSKGYISWRASAHASCRFY